MISATPDDNLARDLEPVARDEVQQAVDAVCQELGLKKGEHERRRAVRERVMDAYRLGRRQPLYLVDAGLGR